jgi:hypothetical protein
MDDCEGGDHPSRLSHRWASSTASFAPQVSRLVDLQFRYHVRIEVLSRDDDKRLESGPLYSIRQRTRPDSIRLIT